MFTNGKARVKIDGIWSDAFGLERGTRQRDPLSQLLFITYINDPVKHHVSTGIPVRELSQIIVSGLYADDLCGYFESREHVQVFLNQVAEWTDTWGLPIGAKQCRIMLFGGNEEQKRELHSTVFHCCRERIPTVREYMYLGIQVNEESFTNDRDAEMAYAETLSEKTEKRMQQFAAILTHPRLHPNMKRHVFQSRAIPVGLGYGAEWIGLTPAIAKVEKQFFKAVVMATKIKGVPSKVHYGAMSHELDLPSPKIQSAKARQRLYTKAKRMNSWIKDLTEAPKFSAEDSDTQTRKQIWVSYFEPRIKTIQTQTLIEARKGVRAGTAYLDAIVPREVWKAKYMQPRWNNEIYELLQRPLNTVDEEARPRRWDAVTNPDHLQLLMLSSEIYDDNNESEYWNKGFPETRNFIKTSMHLPALAPAIKWLSLLRTSHVNSMIEICPCCFKSLDFDDGQIDHGIRRTQDLAHYLLECTAFEKERQEDLGRSIETVIQKLEKHNAGAERTDILNHAATILLGGKVPKSLKKIMRGFGHIPHYYPPGFRGHTYALVANFVAKTMRNWMAAYGHEDLKRLFA